jgi:hypothetical protein
LIRLAAHHPEGVLGFAAEVWWSRLAQPALHSWTDGDPLGLEELNADKTDPDPKALAGYGVLRADTEKLWLRFVQGRPVSALPCGFRGWVSEPLEQEGKNALLLVWDNASWHLSPAVRNWIRGHNREASKGDGVRILGCQLPTKSPWLTRIEPHWVQGKRAVVEPTRKLPATELIARVCDYYGCEQWPHLSK